MPGTVVTRTVIPGIAIAPVAEPGMAMPPMAKPPMVMPPLAKPAIIRLHAVLRDVLRGVGRIFVYLVRPRRLGIRDA